MSALLKGHSVAPTGLEAIDDLSVVFTPPDDLEISFTQQAEAVAEQIQLWVEGTFGSRPWLDLSDPVTFASVQEGTVQNCRVRGVNAGEKIGPASNIVRFDTSLSRFIPRDAKMATFLGNSAANLGVNLDAMTGAVALTRNIGDLLVLIAHIRAPTAALNPTSILLAGWNEIPLAAGSDGGDRLGVIAAYKICDGTETVVPMIDCVGTATNQRVNYHAFSFEVIGTLELGDPIPVAQFTTGNPTARILEVGKEGTDAYLAFASQGATASIPTSIGTSWSIPTSFSSSQETTATVTNRSRASYRIGPAASVKADITVDFIDNGVNTTIFFYFMARAD